MFCTNCGANLKDDARFCINCGQPVKVRPVSQEAPVEAAVSASAAFAAAPEPVAPETPVYSETPVYQKAPAPEAPAPEAPAYQETPFYQGTPAPQGAPMYREASAPQPGPQYIPPVGQGYMPERPTEEKPAKKKFPIWIPIVAGGVLVAGLVLALILIFGKKYKINMNDYVKVDFEGYDTLGEADSAFDAKAFRKEFSEKLKWKKKSYEEQYGSPVDFLIKVYSGALSKEEGLKNGEKVTYKWKLSEEFPKNIMNADISAEDFEIEVKGLKEVEVFDPFEGMEVVFGGVDGYGYLEEIIDGPNIEKYDLYVYPENLDVQFDHVLKNGDEVVVRIGDDDDQNLIWLLAEGYGAVPSAMKKTIVVSGLEEVEAFDPFEELEVRFEGFNGDGDVYLDNKSSLEACKALYFEADPYYNLSNGDEVRVYLDFDEDDTADWAERYGMIPAYTEKTYVVSGLERYAESYEDVKGMVDDMFEFMKGKLIDEYSDRGQYGFSLDEVEYAGYYFMKDDPSDETDQGNLLYLVIHEVVGTDKGEKKEVKTVVMFFDVKVKGEETEFDPDSMSIRYYSQNKVEILSSKAKMTLNAFEDLEGTKKVLGEDETQNKGLVFESSDLD